MFHQNGDQPIEILEVGRVQLVDMPARQILEADIEAFVGGAVARAARVHVRLHAHQQHGVEALGLPVGGIDAALLLGGAPGQRPGGVGHQQRGRAVGMHQVAATGRHAPEAVPLRSGAR